MTVSGANRESTAKLEFIWQLGAGPFVGSSPILGKETLLLWSLETSGAQELRVPEKLR